MQRNTSRKMARAEHFYPVKHLNKSATKGGKMTIQFLCPRDTNCFLFVLHSPEMFVLKAGDEITENELNFSQARDE